MFTYTGGRNLFGTLTNNKTADNLTLGDTFINQFSLELIHKFPFLFGEQTFVLQTYPSQQFYTLPLQLRKLGTVQINVGNTGGTATTGSGFNWPVKECPTMQFWNDLNLTNNITSDIPQYFIYFNGQLGIYPRPATGYNPITIKGQIEINGGAVADYTTGTIVTVPYPLTLTGALAIGDLSATLNGAFALTTGTYQMIFSSGENKLVSLTNGSTAVTWLSALTKVTTTAVTLRTANGGDIITSGGTTLIASMQGYSFQINQPTGDGFWYKIDTVYDTTHFSIMGSYAGNSITAGSSTFIIGQTSVIPPAYQLIPIYRAANIYFTIISKDDSRAKAYVDLANGLEATMKADLGSKDTDPTLEDTDKPVLNPNLAINTTGSSINQ